jgi:hypothetical protein
MKFSSFLPLADFEKLCEPVMTIGSSPNGSITITFEWVMAWPMCLRKSAAVASTAHCPTVWPTPVAALIEFSNRGLPDTPTDDIAARCKVNKADDLLEPLAQLAAEHLFRRLDDPGHREVARKSVLNCRKR